MRYIDNNCAIFAVLRCWVDGVWLVTHQRRQRVDWNAIVYAMICMPFRRLAFQFQENLLRTMLQIENTYFDLGKACRRNCLIICDRGAMDASACKCVGLRRFKAHFVIVHLNLFVYFMAPRGVIFVLSRHNKTHIHTHTPKKVYQLCNYLMGFGS